MVVLIAFGVVLAIFIYVFVRVGWHKQANTLMNEGQYDEALHILSRVIRFYPQDAIALYSRATIYKRQGNYDAALADHNLAIAKGGRMSAMLYGARAYFLMYLGKYEEALNDYEIALKADPTQPQAQLGVAYAYVFMRRYDEALAQAQRAIDDLEHQIATNSQYGAYLLGNSPEQDAQLQNIYISVYATKALALIHLGRGEEAKEIYAKLAEKYPNSMILYTDRAEINFLLADYTSAAIDYEKALSLAGNTEYMPTTSGYDLTDLAQAGYAVALFAGGNIEKAQAQWRDLTTKTPAFAEIERVGKEFFWSEPMTAQAQKLVASL